MIASRYSLTQFGGLCLGLAALLCVVKVADYIIAPGEPEPALSAQSSQYRASVARLGEARGDTIPNLVLLAQGQELHLGETGRAIVVVPAGQTEGRLRVAAVSTGTDPQWVQRHSKMPFIMATELDRAKFAFDGRDIVFKHLAPGSYMVETGLWLKVGGKLITQKKDLGAGSRNCEEYKQSQCALAFSAPVLATLKGKPAPGASWSAQAISALSDVPLKTPFVMFGGLFVWRLGGRRALRAVSSFLSPGLTQHLGALPAPDSRDRPQLGRWLGKRNSG